jgi:hypothetical protein
MCAIFLLKQFDINLFYFFLSGPFDVSLQNKFLFGIFPPISLIQYQQIVRHFFKTVTDGNHIVVE